MRICEVIGAVTLSRAHPSLLGAAWRIVLPLSQAGLAGDPAGRGEEFIVYDELGAGPGSRIAVSEGGEAVAPFHPDVKPIDAYNSAILDSIQLSAVSFQQGKSDG